MCLINSSTALKQLQAAARRTDHLPRYILVIVVLACGIQRACAGLKFTVRGTRGRRWGRGFCVVRPAVFAGQDRWWIGRGRFRRQKSPFAWGATVAMVMKKGLPDSAPLSRRRWILARGNRLRSHCGVLVGVCFSSSFLGKKRGWGEEYVPV